MPNITNLATTAAHTGVEKKYLMLVVQSKKLTVTEKLMKLKKKLPHYQITYSLMR